MNNFATYLKESRDFDYTYDDENLKIEYVLKSATLNKKEVLKKITPLIDVFNQEDDNFEITDLRITKQNDNFFISVICDTNDGYAQTEKDILKELKKIFIEIETA